MGKVRVAVEGCAHGRLDEIYERIQQEESVSGQKVDLLLICGDFQAVRNEGDLACMACPDKYKSMNSFYKYYKGEVKAPVLTIFIGGNHEASNYMQELFYGGWVAPNIFYLGFAGVVRYKGLRIAGLSGIYNERRYYSKVCRYEHPPYTPASQRSVYHLRPLQDLQLSLLSGKIDIFLSHDWPTGIAHFGDKEKLLKKKPFLRKEVENGSLGSPVGQKLLQLLRPAYWFSAHMHVRFEATVRHAAEGEGFSSGVDTTQFLALDKCLPGRQFLEMIDFDVESDSNSLELDPEWLAIVRATHNLLSELPHRLPAPPFLRPAVEEAKAFVENAFAEQGWTISPEGFVQTAPCYEPPAQPVRGKQFFNLSMPEQVGNPQTDAFLVKLGLEHIPPTTISVETGRRKRPRYHKSQGGTSSHSHSSNNNNHSGGHGRYFTSGPSTSEWMIPQMNSSGLVMFGAPESTTLPSPKAMVKPPGDDSDDDKNDEQQQQHKEQEQTQESLPALTLDENEIDID